MRKCLFLPVLLLLLLPACDDNPSTPDTPDTSTDIYAVYSALIDSVFIYPATQMVVIQNMTDPYAFPQGSGRSFIKVSLGVSDTLLNAYDEANASAGALERKFSIAKDYELIADSTFQRLTGGANWDPFFAAYPGAQGYLTLSGIGFSDDGNSALVYASNSSGVLAAWGICALVTKEATGWEVKKYVVVWVT
ncbi:hypothetical protein KQI65_02255 [bacterium]|nr:hypothetical protein [bacterium]